MSNFVRFPDISSSKALRRTFARASRHLSSPKASLEGIAVAISFCNRIGPSKNKNTDKGDTDSCIHPSTRSYLEQTLPRLNQKADFEHTMVLIGLLGDASRVLVRLDTNKIQGS